MSYFYTRQDLIIGNDIELELSFDNVEEDLSAEGVLVDVTASAGGKSVSFEKSALEDPEDAGDFILKVPTGELDPGRLFVRANIRVPDESWPDGYKDYIFEVDTMITLVP